MAEVQKGGSMLEIGVRYLIATGSCHATCLANITKDRALFVMEGSLTPFVSWWHSDPGDTYILNCASGNYYNTLADAIKGENIK